MVALEAEALVKTFTVDAGPIHVLSGISIAAEEGEIISFVGPSGCGKTTLLRILAGLELPTAGKISFGNSVNVRRSFVFQRSLLFPWRTVLENAMLPCELDCHLRNREQDRAAAYRMLDTVGLGSVTHAYPSELSGGMAQRASLARALVTDPQLLFLDEPLSAVDELTRERLWIDFRGILKERAVSTILVTHSIEEAVFLGDRVYVMSPSPSCVRKTISVTLPDPRGDRSLADPAFQSIAAEVRFALRGGGRT